MTDDEAYEQLCDSLWYLLRCQCEQCRDELDLHEFDKLKERDHVAWSRMAAKRALEEGWRSSTSAPVVYCQKCADQHRNGHSG